MRFDDTPSTYQALLTGQVDAMAETGITFDSVMKQNPDAPIEKKFILLRQPNGITMRADQFNLHRWVNTFVYYTKNNGELGRAVAEVVRHADARPAGVLRSACCSATTRRRPWPSASRRMPGCRASCCAPGPSRCRSRC